MLFLPLWSPFICFFYLSGHRPSFRGHAGSEFAFAATTAREGRRQFQVNERENEIESGAEVTAGREAGAAGPSDDDSRAALGAERRRPQAGGEGAHLAEQLDDDGKGVEATSAGDGAAQEESPRVHANCRRSQTPSG